VLTRLWSLASGVEMRGNALNILVRQLVRTSSFSAP
jgi:hypothetical protein